MASVTRTAADRMLQSSWNGIKALAQLGSAIGQVAISLTQDDSAPASKRRTVIIEEDNRVRPSFGSMLSLMATGVANAIRVGRDWMTGRAHQNATGQSVATAVAWELTDPPSNRTVAPFDWDHLIGAQTLERFRIQWRAINAFQHTMHRLASKVCFLVSTP
jgi:hypothetical protein